MSHYSLFNLIFLLSYFTIIKKKKKEYNFEKRIVCEVFEDGLCYEMKSTVQQVKDTHFLNFHVVCLSQCLWVNSQVLTHDGLENLDFSTRYTFCVAFYLHTW